MTPILSRALDLRAKHPEACARTLIAWARQPEAAPLPWARQRNGWPEARIEQDGFDVRIRIDADDTNPDLSWLGEFHEGYTRNAIRVRAPNGWRRSDDHGCAWFTPGTSADEHRKGLRKMGYSRAESDRLAREYVKRDADRLREYYNGDRGMLMVGVDVYRAGIRLAGAGLFGIDVDSDDDPYLTDCARDLISEALIEAKTAIAALCGSR